MKYNDFSWKDIILEAPGDDVDIDDDLAATDYADAEGMDIEESDPSVEDTGDPADEDPLAEEGEEDPADEDPLAEEGDPADEDPLAEEGEGDPADEDPLAEEGEGSDENLEDEQTDNMESDPVSSKQNLNLVNDFIELYNRIDEIMNQVRTDCKTNIRYNPNMSVVRRNMEKLKEVTYDYITNRFAKESYVSNLYQFNLLIQALNTNIELLGSVLASNRKFKEGKEAKKKKNETKKPDNKKKQ
jgi:hypothetical protein